MARNRIAHHRRAESALITALLVCLTGLALTLRVYRLDELPPGLFLDEAGHGLDALDVLAGRPALFFQRSLGKEPLFIYLVVPFVAWLGRIPLAVRLPAALAGAAAVPATFLLVRELLWIEGERRANWAALLSAGLLAGSFWAVSLSRISFRANTLPVIAALAFCLAWRTLRLGGRGWAAAAGGVLGLCFYTYLAGRFIYPLAVAGLIILAATPQGRATLQARRAELSVMVAACTAVMLPLLLHFWLHPGDFFLRAGMVAFTNPDVGAQNPLAQLQHSLAGNLGMFGGTGDLAPRHNLPGRSILSPWLAFLFWIGLLAALVGKPSSRNLFAVAWFGWMLLPAILAADPPRHALRAIGAQPIVYFFPAALLIWTFGWLRLRVPSWVRSRRRWPVTLVLGLGAGMLVAGETALTARDYFGRWANHPAVYDAFLGSDRAIAAEIDRAPADERYVVPLNDRWRALGGKYTLDFLVRRPEQMLAHFPLDPNGTARLADFLDRPTIEEVRVPHWLAGDDVSADPQETTKLLLGQIGQPLETYGGPGYYVERFRPVGAPQRMALPAPTIPLDTRFTAGSGVDLRLRGWNVAHSGVLNPPIHLTPGGIGSVVLAWETIRPPQELLRASLRLRDSLGEPVGQADSTLVDARPRYSTDWQAGDYVVTYHPVHAAPGTPPGPYKLEMVVYTAESGQRLAIPADDGTAQETLPLGIVHLGQPLPSAPAYEPPARLPEEWSLAPGVRLIGHETLPQDLLAGLLTHLALSWSVDPSGSELNGGLLHLMLGDHPAGTAPLALPAGGPWRTIHRLIPPASLPGGFYSLRIGIEQPGAPTGTTFSWVELATVQVAPTGQPQFVLQADFAAGIRLKGWRLEREPESADSTEITLFWETTQPPAESYTAFVHLLDPAGELLAQHDSTPVNGRYPTTLWPPGAIVPDPHRLEVSHLGPGMRLRVGLYLPGSGIRLPTTTGDDFVEWDILEEAIHE